MSHSLVELPKGSALSVHSCWLASHPFQSLPLPWLSPHSSKCAPTSICTHPSVTTCIQGKGPCCCTIAHVIYLRKNLGSISFVFFGTISHGVTTNALAFCEFHWCCSSRRALRRRLRRGFRPTSPLCRAMFQGLALSTEPAHPARKNERTKERKKERKNERTKERKNGKGKGKREKGKGKREKGKGKREKGKGKREKGKGKREKGKGKREGRTRRQKQVPIHNRAHRTFLLIACAEYPHSDIAQEDEIPRVADRGSQYSVTSN